MAVATAVCTVSPFPNGLDMTARRFIVRGPVVITASPAQYPAGGIPITFPAAADKRPPGTTVQAAKSGQFFSRSGSGFVYNWTQIDNWIASYKNTTPAVGQSLVDSNQNIQTVTTSGLTGNGTEPVWKKTKGATTTDGAAVWTNQGPSSGLLQIFEQNGTTGALVELSQAASIPAGVSGDSIAAELQYLKG